MAFPENKAVEFPLDALGTTVQAAAGPELLVNQWSEKGYDIVRGVGAGYTADLEGSVTGVHWTVISGLGASGQGAIPVQFNYLRINCTIAGAYDDDEVRAAGKVL